MNSDALNTSPLQDSMDTNRSASVGRIIAGVVIGYIAMVVVVMMGVGLAWVIYGPDGAFKNNTVEASTNWAITNCISGFVAAICGGIVAAKIGLNRRVTVLSLAGLILAMGLAIAFAQLGADPSELPEGKTSVSELTFAEAGQVARSPDWYNFVIPLIGVTGVLTGYKIIGDAKQNY